MEESCRRFCGVVLIRNDIGRGLQWSWEDGHIFGMGLGEWEEQSMGMFV
jgi:hypothetical protein